MTSSSSANCLDLVQAVKSGDNVQSLVGNLLRYFLVDAIAEGENCSTVDCIYDTSRALDDIREEFKKEFVRSKKVFINPPMTTFVNVQMQLTDVVKAIVPHPKKKYYLSYGVRLLAFRRGWSNLEELVVNKDDCIILIPAYVIGSATGTLKEGTRQTTFTCEVGSELVMSGRCSIEIQPESISICVVLTIGKDKE